MESIGGNRVLSEIEEKGSKLDLVKKLGIIFSVSMTVWKKWRMYFIISPFDVKRCNLCSFAFVQANTLHSMAFEKAFGRYRRSANISDLQMESDAEWHTSRTLFDHEPHRCKCTIVHLANCLSDSNVPSELPNTTLSRIYYWVRKCHNIKPTSIAVDVRPHSNWLTEQLMWCKTGSCLEWNSWSSVVYKQKIDSSPSPKLLLRNQGIKRDYSGHVT